MIDLKELLDQRSTPPADLVQHLRLGTVRQRIDVRRRQRVGGLVAAVLVLGAIGYGLTPAPGDGGPAQQTGSTAGFPQHLHGARVIAAVRSRPWQNSVTLDFVSPGLGTYLVFTDCTGAPGVDLEGELVVGGEVRQTGRCGDGLTMTWQIAEDRKGRDLSIRLRVVATERGTGRSAAFPDGATVAVAVGVPVLRSAYPLPERPAVLAEPAGPQQLLAAWEPQSLPPPSPGTFTKTLDTRLWLRSDPDDPLLPRTVTVRSGDRYSFISQSLTPGSLRLRVDGVDVRTEDWWDYDADLHVYTVDLTLAPYHSGKGRDITLTVTPDQVTGAWQLLVQADTPLPPAPPPPRP
ncbi:hypothetical protein Cs7R123_69060 [Catellatospora sp. TT07R-123]|uniref:hypothetical protein n=1 Tax=Catellatospora sp. TT07R-123 TaxID=2733863 RepID=UPI001B04E619|nr:hypothetical protein [Catellatospora sp. TT07R-123]GHJ49564.1 hypothetical protein Cs7R123_69060 [Catellatospora sp. TT07R-123]